MQLNKGKQSKIWSGWKYKCPALTFSRKKQSKMYNDIVEWVLMINHWEESDMHARDRDRETERQIGRGATRQKKKWNIPAPGIPASQLGDSVSLFSNEHATVS